jgi:hypothetical protein
VIDYLGIDELRNDLEKIFIQLYNDNDPKIRSVMLSTIINVS